MNRRMKFLFCILTVSSLVGIALHYFFERGSEVPSNQENVSVENPFVLDGGYSYVDNDKLLEVLTGTWISTDGHFELTIWEDSNISIAMDRTVVLEDTLKFTYLQPGYVACTEFGLSCWDLIDKDGTTLAIIDFLRHEAAGDSKGNGLIIMEIETADGSCKSIVFEKTLADTDK